MCQFHASTWFLNISISCEDFNFISFSLCFPDVQIFHDQFNCSLECILGAWSTKFSNLPPSPSFEALKCCCWFLGEFHCEYYFYYALYRASRGEPQGVVLWHKSTLHSIAWAGVAHSNILLSWKTFIPLSLNIQIGSMVPSFCSQFHIMDWQDWFLSTCLHWLGYCSTRKGWDHNLLMTVSLMHTGLWIGLAMIGYCTGFQNPWGGSTNVDPWPKPAKNLPPLGICIEGSAWGT
jgi:hypothetical protein